MGFEPGFDFGQIIALGAHAGQHVRQALCFQPDHGGFADLELGAKLLARKHGRLGFLHFGF